jgi:ssDNA-binding replication factor A large subunit
MSGSMTFKSKMDIDDYFDLVSDLMSMDEFEDKISKYNEKFSGLIEKEVLAHLIVDELGRNISIFKSLSELKAGSRASLFVSVAEPEPNIFQKRKGSGSSNLSSALNTAKAAEVYISDRTGRARLLLWDPGHVDLVTQNILRSGVKLKLVNARISKSSYGPGIDITLEGYDSLVIAPKDFPDDDEFLNGMKFSDIDTIIEDGPVNIMGTISNKSQLRTFNRKDKNRTPGMVMNLEVYDGTGTMKLTLWDHHAKSAEKYNVGDNLKIINGYSKLHNNEREIHTSYRTQIILDDSDSNLATER